MKKILLTLLTVVLALGLFGATGYAGYRFGFAQGVQATTTDDTTQLRPLDNFGPRRMPMHGFGFERSFRRGWGPGSFPMMGFGFFSPWMFLGRIAVLVLIVGFIYWLFTRSGWRLTRQTTEGVPPKTESE